MSEHDILMELVDEQIALLKERGLTREEAFVIGATVNDEETVERFGEIEAARIANDAIRKSRNSPRANARRLIRIIVLFARAGSR